jgi:hypothetical protein
MNAFGALVRTTTERLSAYRRRRSALAGLATGPKSWGVRTRTLNDRVRICSVTNYTTPQETAAKPSTVGSSRAIVKGGRRGPGEPQRLKAPATPWASGRSGAHRSRTRIGRGFSRIWRIVADDEAANIANLTPKRGPNESAKIRSIRVHPRPILLKPRATTRQRGPMKGNCQTSRFSLVPLSLCSLW